MFVRKDMDTNYPCKMFNSKRGLSGVIATVLLIGLVVVAIAIVGLVVRNMVSTQVESTESCFGNYNKVTLNPLYTCYNLTSGEMLISLSIGDINVDEVLVAISDTGTTKSFKIKNTSSIIPDLTTYPDGLASTQLPSKNGGLTYVYNLTSGGFLGKPDRIEIAPIINNKQCDTSDTLSSIDDC